jgi:two-component system cell cycle sensor histidine kinase/response regulator CckA
VSINEYEPVAVDESIERTQLLSLGSVVRDALPLLRAAIAEAALLRIAIDARAPLVEISSIAIKRVLLNLVLNASRAIRQPHGVIEIGVARMACSDDRGPQFVRLTVADNGIGMDGATVGKLRQNLVDPQAVSPCPGLGREIVRHAVNIHGGRLQIDSQPGSGTTVRIDLPAGRRPT